MSAPQAMKLALSQLGASSVEYGLFLLNLMYLASRQGDEKVVQETAREYYCYLMQAYHEVMRSRLPRHRHCAVPACGSFIILVQYSSELT